MPCACERYREVTEHSGFLLGRRRRYPGLACSRSVRNQGLVSFREAAFSERSGPYPALAIHEKNGVELMVRACLLCGSRLSWPKVGRPRKFCVECVPPGDMAASMRAWRLTNPKSSRVTR